MDECMEIVRGLTAGGYFEYHGEFYDIPPIKICPVPSRPIPLLVGGHADAALRRAVLRGDGWMHGGGPAEELDELLGKLAAIRRVEGLADKPFEIHVISLQAYTPDGIKRLEERGVTDVIVGFRLPYVVGPDPEPLATKIDHLDRYAENVIAKVAR
jgi:alkanesulfonate monooxygenase SsuD/methylene tetrahydromethanopterin reductase-like flavin-dependent oxidoreductase (luciferase family)